MPSGGQQVRPRRGAAPSTSSRSPAPRCTSSSPSPGCCAAENTQLYQIITVNGDRLDFQARTATGALYDAFVLRKRAPGVAAEFLDLQPATQENRKPARRPRPRRRGAVGAEAR